MAMMTSTMVALVKMMMMTMLMTLIGQLTQSRYLNSTYENDELQ